MSDTKTQRHLDPNFNEQECAREPIQIPGSIQAHGFLIACNPGGEISWVSENIGEFLSPLDPAKVFSQSITDLFFSEEQASQFRGTLLQPPFLRKNPVHALLGADAKAFDVVTHPLGEEIIAEFEWTDPNWNFSSIYQQANQGLQSIENALTLLEACREAALQVRMLTDYARVMIYRFDDQWNGEVIAESKRDGVDSFLGLRYPASDIPEQARELYRKNLQRIIPNVSYRPSKLIAKDPRRPPLDLTYSVLRSVSPVHLQYLKNMQVQASMSLSLIKDGKLWGLIACHDLEPKMVRYENRQACELVARFLSLQLSAKEKFEDRDYRRELFDREKQIRQTLAARAPLATNVLASESEILDLTGSHGVATVFGGVIQSLGNTPTEPQISSIVEWLNRQRVGSEVIATDCLSDAIPQAREFRATASGLLAISIPEPEPAYVLWFRPEVIQTVKWAGNPEKPVEATDSGRKLSPRHSFELWKEEVSLHSLPWKNVEIEVAAQLRRSLIEEDLRRKVEEERATRTELEKSNEQLDQFASIVSHDLREPLRGIQAFARFLKEDLGNSLPEEPKQMVADIGDLSNKMSVLIRDLYEYSRAGRVDLAFRKTSLQAVVESAEARLKVLFQEKNAKLIQHRKLPLVWCDSVRLEEVYANLFANAIKYNQRTEKIIEVDYDDTSLPCVFSVKDNGVGIPKNEQQRLFSAFQRLSDSQRFADGTGVGLAIAKTVIERHQGRIWLSSTPGEGTTFYFTLEAE